MIKIIAHNGKAHQDDFLAACICCYKLKDSEVYRLPYTEDNLRDVDSWVLDQGRRFEPELHNFDHHHIEKEICSFTMILDYFYQSKYRQYLPQLRFLEIFDSYGPIKAAEFVGMPPENIDSVYSPINSSMIGIFSKIEGKVDGPILEIMKQIGEEICKQIEDMDFMIGLLDQSSFFEYREIKILDVTKCTVPENIKHDQLPTKIYSKIKGINPEIILTKDSRQNGFRMVSINTNSLKFIDNELSYFTHNSGFLTGFKKYDDYRQILDNYIAR
jgi:hypothetical protein